MKSIFALMIALCMLFCVALAEPCIAKDGTCPQVVAPTCVFVPAEGENAGDITGDMRPVVSEASLLPWNGALVVGTLPKDAEIADSVQDDFGYAQTLLYDGVVSIVTARFGSVEARDVFVLDNYMPAGAYEVSADVLTPGSNALQIHYACEDGRIVDAFYFADAENYYLFLTAMNEDAYNGTGMEFAYSEFVPGWVESLDIFKP